MKKACLLLFGCWSAGLSAQPKPDFTLRFDQSAHVLLKYRNNPRPLAVSVSTWNVLPVNEAAEQLDTLAAGGGTRLLSVAVRSPQMGYGQIGKARCDLYLLPGDTLQLTIDFASDTVWNDARLHFAGRWAPLQEYHRQRNRTLPRLQEQRAFAANNAPALSAYRRVMDSLRVVENHFFTTYTATHDLPEWFVEETKRAERYAEAALRHNTILYRRFLKKGQHEAIPPDYFAYRQAAPIPNPAVRHLLSYWHLVGDEILLHASRKVGEPIGPDSFREEWKRAEALLRNPRDFEFFKARYLSLMGTVNPAKAMEMLAEFGPTIQNKTWVEVVRASIVSKIKRIQPGDAAPNFHLTDLRDSLVTMREFRGNVVLLCFWFPGCKPCLAEFPHENALVDRFAGKPVKIVSIGTLSGRDAWLRAIEKHGLRTVHLHANENWQKSLEQKYAFQGYPHYVLIDQQGKLVQNFAPRPSQNVAEAIEALLPKP
jgi:peroxiredoxin